MDPPPTPPQPQRSETDIAEARVAGLEGLVGSLARLLGDARQELALAGLTPASRAGQRKGLRNKSSPRSSPSPSSSSSSKPVDIDEDNNNEEHKQAGEKMREKAKEKTSSSSSSSAPHRANNKREPARRKEEEIESAVRAWADSAAAPSASMMPTAGGSPVLSPRGGRRRKEQQAAAQQLSSKAEAVATSSPQDHKRLADLGRIRNRANAVAVPEGTTMPPLPPHSSHHHHHQELKESDRAITAPASHSTSGKATIVEALRRHEEERARQMEAFVAAMERTYIDERERRERDLEELKLADLEREFADMRARLREAIGCNARHAGELAERERRIGKLQAQIRLAKRRVAALERDARDTVARQQRSGSAASSDTSSGAAQQQWSIGRARQRRTRSIDATGTWRPPVWKFGSGGVAPGRNKTGSLDDVTDDGDDDDDDDDYDDDDDESDDVVLSMNRSDLHTSSSSSTAPTYTGVFFPSRRERTDSTVLSSQVSGDRFMASAARQTSLVMPFTAPGAARLALSRETSPRPSVDSDLSDLERRRSHSFGHGTDGGQHSAPVTPSSPFPPELPRSRPQVRIKEKNSKAFAVLGVDPTQAKLMSVLGIDMPMMEDAKKAKKIKDDDAYIAPSWDLRGSVSAQQKKNRLISRVSHKVRGVRD